MVLLLKSILLGIVQGLTEFLPVSSSGHLALSQIILKTEELGVTFDVFLHFGTLGAIVIVFRKSIVLIIKPIIKPGKNNPGDVGYSNLILKIILSAIPATVVGLLFQDEIESIFHNLFLLSIAFLTTGTVLWLTRKKTETDKDISYLDAIIIGAAQALALLPGISRSGMTISTALLLNNEREKSAEFSFLMVIPLIFGASVLKLGEVITSGQLADNWLAYLIGTFTAFIVVYQ